MNEILETLKSIYLLEGSMEEDHARTIHIRKGHFPGERVCIKFDKAGSKFACLEWTEGGLCPGYWNAAGAGCYKTLESALNACMSRELGRYRYACEHDAISL